MREGNGGAVGGDEGFGGLLVGGGAFVLVLGGVYQATQADQANEATPYIAGVVAIAVALITWFATDRRQAKALAAERERLDETLAEERAVRELEELRKVLDEAMDALAAANIGTARAVWDWKRLPTGVGAEERSALTTKVSDAYNALMDANAAWYRLTLRVGYEHPVAKSLRDVHDAILALVQEIELDRPPTDNEVDRLNELGDARAETLDRFRAAAVELVGSRLGR
jgi:hypothetical protein